MIAPEKPRALVIFDRDGTLIDFHRDAELGVVTPAFHPAHVRFLPGALDALRLLQERGHPLAVASNQPGAAKGELTREVIERTMSAFEARLAAAGITLVACAVCFHHPLGGEGGDPALVGPCACRKPRPGMLLELAARAGVPPSLAWMVGDTPTDLEAGYAAGMRTALLGPTRRCELCPLKAEASIPTPTVHAPTLLEIARAILAAHDPA